MDKMAALEEAIKNIFLYCLNEPDLLKAVKDKLTINSGNTCDCEEKQAHPLDCSNDNNNTGGAALNEKINQILTNQKSCEDWIKEEHDKVITKIDERLAEIENTMKQYNESLKSENKSLRTENKSLRTENEGLKSENEGLKSENEGLKSENEGLKSENEGLRSENEKLLSEEEIGRKEISQYSVFHETLEVLNGIYSLDDENKEYIERLCGSLDMLAIISLGRDDGRIEQLWSYLRDLAVKSSAKDKEVSNLNRYFEFCLKTANSAKTEAEKYVMLNIERESEFDMDTCIRTSDSRQFGKIREIAVGCVMLGKKIKYKAVVRVE